MGRWLGKLMTGSGAGATGNQFYASTSGGATNAGTIGSPWTLAVALSGGYPGGTVQPGDTIWLRGGTYSGQFTSSLVGNAGSYINVKQYGHGTSSRERVTLDGYNAGNSTAAIVLGGSYTNYYDIETICGSIVRTTATPGSTPPNGCNNGIAFDNAAHDLNVINFVVHDTCQGPYFAKLASNILFYGGLCYYNGWDGPDRGHGHFLYFQNVAGWKKASDCIGHNSFDLGVQARDGSNPDININVTGTVSYDSGRISSFGSQSNWYLSTTNSTFLYQDMSYSTTNEYDFPARDVICTDYKVTDGYWMNSYSFDLTTLAAPIVVDGNTFVVATPDNVNSYGTNTILGARPGSGKQIFVRPNSYETGRGNIIVFNWDHSATVSVNVGSVGLGIGDNYEVRHSMDFYGTAVASGVYSGANITIPMTGLPIATPINYAAPGGSFPEFAAFTIWRV